MLNQIKDLENQIEQHERQLKLKQNKLESLHPKLNQIIEVRKNNNKVKNKKVFFATNI